MLPHLIISLCSLYFFFFFCTVSQWLKSKCIHRRWASGSATTPAVMCRVVERVCVVKGKRCCCFEYSCAWCLVGRLDCVCVLALICSGLAIRSGNLTNYSQLILRPWSVSTHSHTHTHAHMRACKTNHTAIHLHAYICSCICVYMCVCASVFMHKCILICLGTDIKCYQHHLRSLVG